MKSNGYNETAAFIRLVRNWFQACDERGMKADKRVEHLYNINDFLTSNTDFDTFPSKVDGRYVRGMPVQTFEALLQNISTHILLYTMAKDGKYNTRSVSTLANKSYFSDINRLDKEGGNSYPKAVNMLKIIGKVVTVNHYKHKHDKYVLLISF